MCFKPHNIKLQQNINTHQPLSKGPSEHTNLVKNKQRHVFTNGTFKKASLTTNCHDTLNKYINAEYQEQITTNAY